jgi:predicted CXXCH cytochrome family protein
VKRILALASIAVLAVAATGSAQNTAVIAGGPHDLTNGSALRNTNTGINAINGQTCVFCHTPHGAANSIPLWNRSAPTGAGYQLYTSSTSSVTATPAAVVSGVSGACMSCHDGSIAMDVLLNVNGVPFTTTPLGVNFTTQAGAKATYSSLSPGTNNRMTGGLPFIGTDLRNDHPVAITYETARTAKPAEYVTQTIAGVKITVGTTNPLPLFGSSTATATIECASCHNAHNNTLGSFLRKSNTGSAICLSCHIK